MNARRLGHSALLACFATAAIACGSKSDDKPAASGWVCGSSEVPMGTDVHCTQSALLIDPSIGDTEACTGPTDNPDTCTTYECNAGDVGCPAPSDESGGAGGTTDTSGTPPPSTDTTPPPSPSSPPVDSSGGTSDLPPTTTSGGAGGTSHGANAGGNGNGPKSSDAGGQCSECGYVDSLPYCGDAGAGAGSSTTPPDTSTDTSCDKQNCGAPGQAKKAPPPATGSSGSSSDTPPAAGSGSAGGSGGSHHYKCTKDAKGNKSCDSVPTCGTGTHASACGACVTDGDSTDCVPPSEGGCWVTGGGFIVGPNVVTGAAPDGNDNFGGNAKPMKDGHVQGHWNHVDHGTGDHALGTPEYIVCRHVDEPGPGQPGGKKGFTMNQVYFGGHAEWQTGGGAPESGYWFDVVAKDHGEPGSVPNAKNGFMPDTYHFTIRKMDDPAAQVSGAVIYETKGVLQGGNIQMHPPNNGHPYTPMGLPGWVGFEP